MDVTETKGVFNGSVTFAAPDLVNAKGSMGVNFADTGNSEGSRSVLLAKCFLRAWGTKAKTPHISRNELFLLPCRRRRARLTNHYFLAHVWLLALVHQASNKPLRDPFELGVLIWFK